MDTYRNIVKSIHVVGTKYETTMSYAFFFFFFNILLHQFGIDLSTQQAKNQMLAKKAYHLGLVTLDMTSASELISYDLVDWLLPPSWFNLLDLARVKHTLMPDGRKFILNKFSSMGNGYTFELETLIYASVVYSTVPPSLHHLCAVNGDDMIYPKDYHADIVRILTSCGFVVNTKKTHTDGDFFESCGKHYFCGRDVTPFYLDDSAVLPRAMLFANALRLWSYNDKIQGCDKTYKRLWSHLVSKIPKCFKRKTIPSIPAGGYIDSFDKFQKAPDGLERCVIVTYVQIKMACYTYEGPIDDMFSIGRFNNDLLRRSMLDQAKMYFLLRQAGVSGFSRGNLPLRNRYASLTLLKKKVKYFGDKDLNWV
jgi:hypothetical protein